MDEKGRRWRAKMRMKAIKAMGGCCARCGFSNANALQFDHVTPTRRGLSGIAKSKRSSCYTYRDVLKGKADGIQLLCANCHAIKTRQEDDADGSLSLNWSHSETLRQRLQGGARKQDEPAQIDLLF